MESSADGVIQGSTSGIQVLHQILDGIPAAGLLCSHPPLFIAEKEVGPNCH